MDALLEKKKCLHGCLLWRMMGLKGGRIGRRVGAFKVNDSKWLIDKRCTKCSGFKQDMNREVLRGRKN